MCSFSSHRKTGSLKMSDSFCKDFIPGPMQNWQTDRYLWYLKISHDAASIRIEQGFIIILCLFCIHSTAGQQQSVVVPFCLCFRSLHCILCSIRPQRFPVLDHHPVCCTLIPCVADKRIKAGRQNTQNSQCLQRFSQFILHSSVLPVSVFSSFP